MYFNILVINEGPKKVKHILEFPELKKVVVLTVILFIKLCSRLMPRRTKTIKKSLLDSHVYCNTLYVLSITPSSHWTHKYAQGVQGHIQKFVQGGLNFFLFPGGGLSTRWGLKTP